MPCWVIVVIVALLAIAATGIVQGVKLRAKHSGTIVDLTDKLECRQCGHQWLPRTTDVRCCPACASRFWDRDRPKQRGKG